MPDLRDLLDLPVRVGLVRRTPGPEDVSRMDSAGFAFHRRVRHTYRKSAAISDFVRPRLGTIERVGRTRQAPGAMRPAVAKL